MTKQSALPYVFLLLYRTSLENAERKSRWWFLQWREEQFDATFCYGNSGSKIGIFVNEKNDVGVKLRCPRVWGEDTTRGGAMRGRLQMVAHLDVVGDKFVITILNSSCVAMVSKCKGRIGCV